MSVPVQKTLTFIQYNIPPLKSGEYTVTATQTVNQAPPNKFIASRQFAVAGNRFQLQGDDIVSVFPQALANGEFTGVMPLVVLNRETLPWQRTSVKADMTAPWLALLLFDESEAPTVCATTAAALFPENTTITVYGSTTTGTGTMPAGTISYPNINPLDYGETPNDPCSTIDIPVALFSKIAPSAADLPLLAHIRETDTYDSEDNTTTVLRNAIVLGNRWPQPNTNVYAFLVSLENMGDLLPNDDGTPSANMPAGAKTVRLVSFYTWRFFANDLDEKFKTIVENLNKDANGNLGLTTVRLPAAAPDPTAFATAVQHQAMGALQDGDADVLVQNALCLGYTALNHHLREAGNTVSWYRGPLLPFAFASEPPLTLPASCPDALTQYDPQAGLFDVSYAAAWQLGQLLALQSTSFSVALYSWKKALERFSAMQQEQATLEQILGSNILPSVVSKRSAALQNPPPLPQTITDFIGGLKLLKGVPFAYLVPDEGMLPVESLRFFQLDLNWTAALIDGAFSIGRAGAAAVAKDAAPLAQSRARGRTSARTQRKNSKPVLRAQSVAAGDAPFEIVTGFLLRSQVVSGWPRLNVNGYSDPDGYPSTELPKLRMERLSNDVLLCLFEGGLQMLAIHEAPEQLHCGVEGSAPNFTTTLREVTGTNPGSQYITDPKGGPPDAGLLVRADAQTLRAAASAQAIQNKLNSDFGQNITKFTAAEFALEMIKGVVKVEFKLGT